MKEWTGTRRELRRLCAEPTLGVVEWQEVLLELLGRELVSVKTHLSPRYNVISGEVSDRLLVFVGRGHTEAEVCVGADLGGAISIEES